MSQQDSKTWNSVIRGLCIDAKHKEALTLFFQCFGGSVVYKPSHLTFATILKSCTALLACNLGRALHSFIVKQGYGSCQVTSKALLNMYAKCGAFDDCQKLFDMLSPDDPVIWNTVISGFSRSKKHDYNAIQTFWNMHVSGEAKPNSITVATILPICARSRDLDAGKCAHAYAIKSGYETATLVGNALVSFYAKCGLVSTDAFAVFSNIIHKDVVSCNAMIAGLAENEFFEDALALFRSMMKGPVEPNYATIASILPICTSFDRNVAYYFGRQIHCYVLQRIELSSNISVSNSLLSFYVKVGQVAKAEYLFRKMDARDLVSWNAIIAGYAFDGEWLKALRLFGNLTFAEMLFPDSVTIVSILAVCAQVRNIELGKQIHSYVFRNSFLFEDTTVGNACVNFYAKCGDTEAAYHAFFMISKKDVISWNSILDAFGDQGRGSKFLCLLHWMHREEIRHDAVTMLTIINLCASLLQVKKVKEVHSYSIKNGFLGFVTAPTVGNAILDAYSKCGNMVYAHNMFLNLSERRNLVTYNSLISGYVDVGLYHDANLIFKGMSETDITTWNLMVRAFAENDFPEQAACLFSELQALGMKPDALTIMSLLPACTQMASIHLLNQCHGYITRSCLDDVRLNGALLDAYAKCGNVTRAYKLFYSSNGKDLVMFTTMIGGYAMHGMSDEALGLFSHMLNLGIKPDHVIFTSVLSACSHVGLVDEGLKIFYSMEKIHGIRPTLEQYACVVDLLARGGRVNDAYALVTAMPIKANANVWGTLLGACKIYHEVELGRVVADQLFEIDSDDVGNYVVMSNLYAADARWDGVMEVRRMMKNKDMKKPVGCSWIEVDRTNNVFAAGDYSHPQRGIIYTMLHILDQQIKEPVQFMLNATGGCPLPTDNFCNFELC